MKTSYKAIDIAKYVVNKCTIEDYPISNLQLQKILYYIQKDFLKLDMEAFSDEIEAWQFGPVVPEVYYYFCGFGSLPISLEFSIDVCNDFKDIINPIVEEKKKIKPMGYGRRYS